MRVNRSRILIPLFVVVGVEGAAVVASAHHRRHPSPPKNVQVGPRPYYLLDDMDDGPLKDKLQSCSEDSLRPTQFSIGHRGAALQFPEETLQSIEAAARMG